MLQVIQGHCSNNRSILTRFNSNLYYSNKFNEINSNSGFTSNNRGSTSSSSNNNSNSKTTTTLSSNCRIRILTAVFPWETSIWILQPPRCPTHRSRTNMGTSHMEPCKPTMEQEVIMVEHPAQLPWPPYSNRWAMRQHSPPFKTWLRINKSCKTSMDCRTNSVGHP